MLTAILVWIYIFCVTLIYGLAFSRLVYRTLQIQGANKISFTVFVVVGLNVTAWLSSIFSFVLNMGLVSHLLVLFGAFALYIYLRKDVTVSLRSSPLEKNALVWLMILLGVVVTLVNAVKVPSNPDTVLYHAQAIHWAEDYPVIPGLGNIDPRLGAGSNWFVVNALFSFSFLDGQSFHLLPSFLFLTCLIYFLGGLRQILSNDVRTSDVARVAFVPLIIHVGIGEISSPGTDLPVILSYWLVLCLWLESMEKDAAQLHPIILILSVPIVTFKMSGLPVLLIALWILTEKWKQCEYRSFWIHALLMIAILAPWIARNFIQSGYWLYPEPLMRFISPHVDWAMPVGRVESFKTGIHAWAISPGANPDDLIHLSWIRLFRLWFIDLTQNQKAGVAMAVVLPLLLGAAYSLLSGIRDIYKKYWMIIAVSYLGLFFWLFTVPGIRFGYGYLLGAIVMAGVPLGILVFKAVGAYQRIIVLVVVLLLFIQQVYVIAASSSDDTHYAGLMILPADYPKVPTVACDLGDVRIQCSYSWRACSYDAFPCVPVRLNNVEMRGPTFQDGFRSSQSLNPDNNSPGIN